MLHILTLQKKKQQIYIKEMKKHATNKISFNMEYISFGMTKVNEKTTHKKQETDSTLNRKLSHKHFGHVTE